MGAGGAWGRAGSMAGTPEALGGALGCSQSATAAGARAEELTCAIPGAVEHLALEQRHQPALHQAALQQLGLQQQGELRPAGARACSARTGPPEARAAAQGGRAPQLHAPTQQGQRPTPRLHLLSKQWVAQAQQTCRGLVVALHQVDEDGRQQVQHAQAAARRAARLAQHARQRGRRVLLRQPGAARHALTAQARFPYAGAWLMHRLHHASAAGSGRLAH